MKTEKLVFFGINADPPHLGHLHVLNEVEKSLGPETLFVVMPTGDHPQNKPQMAAKKDRLAMTQRLFSGYKHVRVDDFEILKHGPSYTLDSLIYLKGHYPHKDLYFIMAVDVANHFFSWHEPLKICQIAIPIIISRPGYHLDEQVKMKLEKLTHILILKNESLDISSTNIRHDLKMKKNSKDLSPSVLEYIHNHHLYI